MLVITRGDAEFSLYDSVKKILTWGHFFNFSMIYHGKRANRVSFSLVGMIVIGWVLVSCKFGKKHF